MTQQATALFVQPLVATGVVAANRFVTSAGAQAGADAVTCGASATAAAIGDRMPVTLKGSAIVETGAAISAGATLKSDASGRAITWVTSGAKTAITFDSATGAGQFIEAILLDNA